MGFDGNADLVDLTVLLFGFSLRGCPVLTRTRWFTGVNGETDEFEAEGLMKEVVFSEILI